MPENTGLPKGFPTRAPDRVPDTERFTTVYAASRGGWITPEPQPVPGTPQQQREQ